MNPSLRARLLEGETLLGGFVTWAEGGLVELLAHTGFDLAVLDCEHGLSGAAAVENLVRAGDAAGIPAIVRAPSPASDLVGRYLDAGARGILFPRVRSADDARRAAEAARYAPLGTRGLGAARANRYATRPLGDFVRHANEETIVAVQIETVGALEEVAAIAALSQVDLLFVGPNDLSQALGSAGDVTSPAFVSALERIAAVARGAGKAAGIMLRGREQVPELASMGYRFFTTSDRSLLLESGRAWRAAV